MICSNRNTVPDDPSSAPHRKPNAAGSSPASTPRTGTGHARRSGGGKLVKRCTDGGLLGAAQCLEDRELPSGHVLVQLLRDRERHRPLAVQAGREELRVAREAAGVA